MSRAGKYPVEIKNGVSVDVTDNAVVVKGPKGELKVSLDTKNAHLVDIKVEDGNVVVTPKDAEDKTSRAMWGTMTRNIKAAVKGVSEGFSKAMYMADESALRQKQAIEETGFYSQLLSSSAVETIVADSIELDKEQMSFKYYGTQMIKRRTNSVKRSIITVGKLRNVPRTQNNPHGLLITNWRTLENKDLKSY